MKRNDSAPVEPHRPTPPLPDPPIGTQPGQPGHPGNTEPVEDGDFCRGEIRSLDDPDGLGSLFQRKNHGKSGHSSLACSLLYAGVMTAHTPHHTLPAGSSRPATPASDVVSRTPWFVEEQPRFHDGLRIFTPIHRDSGPNLQLRPTGSRDLATKPSTRIPTQANHPSNRPPRAPRGSVAIPLFMVAAICLLGYVAAVQSVSAFQSAWRNTDTQNFQETARAQSIYHADQGQIPPAFSRPGQ